MIKLQNTMSGRFKIERYKADKDGNPIEESKEVAADWFDNLILDQGLNGLGARSITNSVSRIHVGSGSSEPAGSDTSLQSLVAVSGVGSINSGQGAQVLEQPYFLFNWGTRRFSAGSAAGNLSEVGAGWGEQASNLFSRALILDSNGNPTTITVLPDEVLDVTYEVRLYPSVDDVVGVIELGGELYDYTARPAQAGTLHSTNGWNFGNHGTSSRTSSAQMAYAGEIGSALDSPSGSSDRPSGSSQGEYSNGSLVGSASYTFGLDRGNIGGIRSVMMGAGWSLWQIEFASQVDGSPIPKDDTKELTLTISHSWARRPD